VEAAGDQVALADGAVVFDLDPAARDDPGDLERAAGGITGTFLEGFHVPGAPEFEGWLEAERRQWTTWSIRVLTQWSAVLLGRGRGAEAVTTAERAIRLDPLSEAAIAALLRALGVQGDRSLALDRFERYRAALHEAIGVEPSKEIAAIAARLRSHGGRVATPPRPTEGPDLRRLPLIEREEALGRLVARFNRSLTTKTAQVVLVQGDFGSGKTRLLEELAARARMDGAVVVAIRAVQADRSQSGSGLIGLLEGLGPNAPGVGGASPAALAAIGRQLPEWSSRYRGAGPAPADLPLIRSAVEVLRAVAEEQPLLLEIDDADWLDDDSARAIEIILRDLAKAPLTVVATRGADPHLVLDQIQSRVVVNPNGENLRLGWLTGAGVKELVAGAFPRYDPAHVDRLARRLMLDSGGVPLFAVELVHAIGHGLEWGGEGTPWPAPDHTLTDTLPADLPGSIVASFRIGFRRLSKPAQQVLAAAAVLPDRVAAERIAAVAELDLSGATTALDELEWQRWLVSEPRGYAFVNRIARDVILRDMVTAGQRRRLEQRAAAPPAV
jgi:hypothetical protein